MTRLSKYYEQKETSKDEQLVSCMPPLDLISASSISCSDSVSSLETDDSSLIREEFSPFTPPRTIFKLYWDKSGSSPQEILPPPLMLGETAFPVTKKLPENTGHGQRMLSKPEQNDSLVEEISPCQSRRSIFGDKTWSSERLNHTVLPPLPLMDHIPKASSTSSLCSRHREDIPLTPCLKSSPRRQRTKSTDSVKFSTEVNVRLFCPDEKYATKEWFKWFV